MRVTNTLAFAAGHWRIERVLEDHRSGTEGRFAGRAALTGPDLPGGPLEYLETGELHFGTHTGPATPSTVLTCAAAAARRSTSAARTATRSPTWCSATTRWKSAGGCAGRTRTTRRPRP